HLPSFRLHGPHPGAKSPRMRRRRIAVGFATMALCPEKPLQPAARPLFHLAFPVHDLASARAFYGELLGCPEGRSSPDWVDFDFYGHQIVAHLVRETEGQVATNPVDGEDVPVRHFGAILEIDQWTALTDKLKKAGTRFIIEPQI